jgi:hypothetical protein
MKLDFVIVNSLNCVWSYIVMHSTNHGYISIDTCDIHTYVYRFDTKLKPIDMNL